jgi:hypothetical protein
MVGCDSGGTRGVTASRQAAKAGARRRKESEPPCNARARKEYAAFYCCRAPSRCRPVKRYGSVSSSPARASCPTRPHIYESVEGLLQGVALLRHFEHLPREGRAPNIKPGPRPDV